VLTVARYRFRPTFIRRWPGYLAIVVLIGLLGGLAMGSIAGARRTQSSYPTFLASTNPSDLTVSAGSPNSNASSGSSSLTNKIAHLAGVKGVADLVAPTVIPLDSNGAPRIQLAKVLQIYGSLNGELFDQDRLTVVKGRMADPNRADEVVMTASAAQLLGVHLGEVVPLGFRTDPHTELRGFGTPNGGPRLRVRARLVGIVVFNNQVVQDDVDRAYGFLVLTPAFIREAAAISRVAAAPVLYGLQLDHGSQDVPMVEQEFIRAVPPDSTYEIHATSRAVAQVELAVKSESVALGGFGAIAALITLVLGIQAIARQLRWGDDDRRVLRALGASRATTTGDGLAGVLAAVVLGSLLATAVAVGLSPLAPLGPVRPVYPYSGVTFDWTVLGVGLAVLVAGLGAAAVVLSYRGIPYRVSRNPQMTTRSSRVARGAEAAGMPVSGVVGVRFALEPGRARTSVPVRSALVGTALAVALLVGTLTFASGLHTLVSSPALYGWNWNYMLSPNASDDIPPQVLKLLNHDPVVASWGGVSGYGSVEIESQDIPILWSNLRASVTPPILSGHGLEANNQIVLGAGTMALLHRHVGDTVTITYGTPQDDPIYIPPTKLRIVGTATFPAVGSSSFVADHTSMGTGALIPTGVEPPAFQRALLSPDPNLNGPGFVFVRLRNGVSAATGRADMQRIANAANKIFAEDPNGGGNRVTVQGVQRPAQIVNYQSIGSTPIILAAALALGAIVALTLTLVASVRHRRRDLALLKALGFTPRQLAVAIAWQSSVAAVVGIIVGVPAGIVVGRQIWILFARNINAVPDPTVPVVPVILVAVGVLIFANVVAALPGRIAARTSTALVLRAE
jgi:hypothetical protein